LQDVWTSIALQEDGKIIVAGYSSTSSDTADIVLGRYNMDGSIDSSFGTNGLVTTRYGAITLVASIAIQKDKKIIVGANNPDQGVNNNIVLIRYSSAGEVDSSFGTNGNVSADISNRAERLSKLVIQGDDKIVVSATSFDYTYKDSIAVLRYLPGGTLDQSFNKNGKNVYGYNDLSVGAGSCIIKQDGTILVCGYIAYDLTKWGFIVVQYRSNGLIDSSFGTNGVAFTDFGNGRAASSSLVQQSDGKIIICGTYQPDGAYHDSSAFALARFMVNGDIDNDFGTAGRVITYFDGDYHFTKDAEANNIFIQNENKIVVTGTSGNQYSFALARYLASGEVLAINTSSFSAFKKQSSVLLNWQAAPNKEYNHFIIERSNYNGREFKEIGYIRARNTDLTQLYSYEDFSPVNDKNYYRLKQVDNENKFTYSKILLIDFSYKDFIKLYPNPASDFIRLEGMNAASKTISIFDLNGHMLKSVMTFNTDFIYNINQLPAGIYYVKIKTNNDVKTLKFEKQ
jgi:uncharacterized delta-60 repeat protein